MTAETNPAATERPWRWVIIALLFFGTVVNYLDRLAIPVLSPVLQADFHLTNLQYASISSSFLITYALTTFVWGAVFDRFGNRPGFSFAVVIWSLAEIGHAFAASFTGLCGLRASLGVGEAGQWPGATRTIAAWFPARQRALAIGIANAGASLGPALAPPFIIWLQLLFGWRTVFIVTGSLGFLWLALWLALYPKAGATGTAGPAAVAVRHVPVPWRVLLRRREVWGIVLGRFFGDPIWWLYLNWLPLYLTKERGFSLKEIAAFAWAPFVGAALGALTGGWFSGFLIRCGWSVNRARKSAILVGTICLTTGILAAYATSPYAALGWMCVSCFGFQCWVGNVQTLPSDFFPVGAVGSIAGFAGTAAGLGAVIFTQSTGWVVDHFSYTPILVTAGLLGPLATTVLFVMIGRVRTLDPA